MIGKRKKASFLYTRHAPIFGFPNSFSRLFSFVFAALDRGEGGHASRAFLDPLRRR